MNDPTNDRTADRTKDPMNESASRSVHRNPDQLQHLYEQRFAGRAEYRNGVWQRLIHDYFSRWIGPNDVVLDLGSGHGEFINNVQAAKRYALDLNPDAKEAVGPGVEMMLHDCTTPWPLPTGSVDVVFSSNFFEHLPDKDALLEALAQAHTVLRPGGRLVAMGPNVRFVHGEYWDYIDHHIPLTERSLAEAMTTSGFRVTHTVPRFLPYSMSEGRPVPLQLVSAYVKLPLAWRVFGKQFVVVAERR
jgi:SAM-dependent methyltransferase